MAAVREQDPLQESNYSQNIPVEVTPPASGLVNTRPLPNAVQLRLLAPTSSWTDLSPTKFKAWVDLSEAGPGLSDVPVNVEVSDRQISIVEQTPSVVGVNLESVKTISMPVEVEVLDSPPLGYINRAPVAEPAWVEISGPVSVVDRVEKVVSEVSIRNSKETLQTLSDVAALNGNNRPVRTVQLEPSAVQVTLPIEQRFGYKEVSVRVRVEGQVASGYRVSNILVDPPTLTVVGNPRELNRIAGLIETVPINLDQATESIVRTVPLNLPNGVTAVVSEEERKGPGGVQVTVEITPIEDGITLQRPISQQGIDPDYWWRASPDQADVFLSGPLTRLQTLQASDVEVLVDLFDLDPGVHILRPTVFKPDGLSLDAILPDTIEITIGRTIQRPVRQEGLSPDYTWKASPDRINVLLLEPSEQLDSIQPADIEATVDLSGLEPGFYKLSPQLLLPEEVVIDSVSPETVNVTIELKPDRLTPTPPVTATRTITNSTTTAVETVPPNRGQQADRE